MRGKNPDNTTIDSTPHVRCVQFVDCYTSDHYCDTTTLARVVFDSPGTLGQYPEYRVNATLTVIQVRQQLHGGRRDVG